MPHQKRNDRRRGKKVHQNRSKKPRILHKKVNTYNSAHWTQSTAYTIMASILVIIAMFIIGLIFLNPLKIPVLKTTEHSTSNKLGSSLCPVPDETMDFPYLMEDSLITPDYKLYFYQSRLSFVKAQEVCRSIHGGGDLVTIQSSYQEKLFDERIADLAGRIFIDDGIISSLDFMKFWTGGYIDLETGGINRIMWLDGKGLNEWHLNFCDIDRAMQVLKITHELYTQGMKTNPFLYIVKNYNGAKKMGCWTLFIPKEHDEENTKLNFACQVPTARLPFKFIRRFLGKFRHDENDKKWANEYVTFSGRSTYNIAQETCKKLAPGSQMLATKSLGRDHEVNKRVERYYMEIFGEDNGDPKRRTLIWTGGYFNLSSTNPTKLRWTGDLDANLETYHEPTTHPNEYENFCGTIEYYHKLINNAISEERDAAATTGCIRDRIFVVTKDFREGQPVQGCWHVYDLDYLIRHDYKLHLICQLRDPVMVTDELYKESEEIFSYKADSTDP